METSKRADIGRQEFEQILKDKGIEGRDFQLIMLAYRLAKYGHRGQTRKGGERYFEHVKGTTLIVVQEFGITRTITIIKALLHDIVEDSFILLIGDIEIIFGKEVAKGIAVLSKDRLLERTIRDKAYGEQLKEAMEDDLIVKMADRIHNMRTVREFSPEKRREYTKETRELHMVLAQKIREPLRSCILNELERLCLEQEKELS